MNKEQKKRIIGVAVIGSVILISVATGGTVRISRNRRKRNEEELYAQANNVSISAEATSFGAVEEDIYYKVKGENNKDLFSYKKSGGKFYASSGKGTNMEMVDGLSLVVPPTNTGSTFEGYYYTYMGTEYKIIDSKGKFVNNSTNNNFPQYLFNTVENITLTAKWTANTYYNVSDDEGRQLFLYTNDGTNIFLVGTATGGANNDVMADGLYLVYTPPKTGSTFEGYYYTYSGTEYKIIDSNGCLVLNSTNNNFPQYLFKTIGGNITLNAKWTSNRIITYTLDPNGGTQSTDNLYVNGDGNVYSNSNCSTATYSVTMPTKSGYIFKGYEIGSEVVIDNRGVIDITKLNTLYNSSSGSLYKLVAKWEEAEIMGIGVQEYPNKIEYLQGEDLDLTGAELIITKSDGSFSYVDITSNMVSGYDKNTIGEQTITVTYQGKTTTFKVTVKAPEVKVESIILSDSTKTLKVGESADIVYSVTPSTATNKEVRWSSDDESVATVDENGRITANKAGTATITVTAKDGSGIKATCAITVNENKVDVESVTLSATASEINIGGSTQLTATVTPDNATNKKVTYSSSDTSIATVGETTGLVTGVSEGEVTITVTTEDGSKTDTIKIKVVKQEESKEDTTKPELNLEGKWLNKAEYLIYIKATDADSGVDSVVIVNDDGTEIPVTQKDENGYYFKPLANGTYTIKVKDKSGNTETKTYKVEALLEKTTIEAAKDSEGKDIVYITPITNKNVKSVMVNGKEITDKTEDGRFYFYPNANGKYTVKVSYENANGNENVEEIEHEETRIEEDNTNGNETGNNSGNGSNNGSGSNTGSNVNNGSASSGTSSTGGTSNSTSLSTIGSSKSSSNLPYAGSTGMGALIAAIVSSFSAAFAWIKTKFKNKK